MSGLKIGDRVRTPQGDGVIADHEPYAKTWRVVYPEGHGRQWYPQYIEPLPADIPRERVEALLADVERQTAELDPSPHNRFAVEVRRELSTVIASLREMLEVTDG